MKLTGIRWRGRVYKVPSEMEAFKANALLTTGQAERVYEEEMKMRKYRLTWAPEGKTIAIVEAKDAASARKKAPQPYRKYLGEIAVDEIL